MTYEAAPGFDDALTVSDPTLGLPLAWFGAFESASAVAPIVAPADFSRPALDPTVSQTEHASAVREARQRIAAGDTYQVNLSFRLRGAAPPDPVGLYGAVAVAQRGAHNVFIDTGAHAIACASPELFFSLDGSRLVTRPMKGTAARGRWHEEDVVAASALPLSEKEVAENLMIVDLLRNDMGVVSEFGSVTVDDLFSVERYETVWQMTSTIRSTIRPDVGLAGVMGALFPCGSVTGAPKPSTMAIIAELEAEPRGIYCGAIGLIEPGARRARFSVAIRTAMIDHGAGTLEYGIGGGVTWDSAAADEHAEAVLKAAVLDGPRPPFDLLTTVRAADGDVVLRERHLERLRRSAAYFRYPFDEKVVSKTLDLAAAASAHRQLRLRLTLSAKGLIVLDPAPLPDDAGRARLVLDDRPIDRDDPMLFHKTTHRARYEQASARFPDADEVVLWNADGEVTETTISSIAVKVGGGWITPPATSGCLPGAARAEAIATGEVAEGVVTLSALRGATEIAVFNAVRGRRSAGLETDPDR